MGYGIDLSKVSVTEYFHFLGNSELFPSHKVLENDIEVNRDKILGLGINDVQELYQLIKTKSKLSKFMERIDLEEEYLQILKRHISSFIPKKRMIKDFVLVSEVDRNYLIDQGITDSFKLLKVIDQVQISEDSRKFFDVALELMQLRYVGPSYVSSLYLLGIGSIQGVLNWNAENLRDGVNKMSSDYNLSPMKIGAKDCQFMIDDAKLFLKWTNR